jgi:hypothetical protein
MTRGDCRLQRVRPSRSTKPFGALEGGKTTTDEELIPPRAVLSEP